MSNAEHSRAEIDRIVTDYFHRLDVLEPVSRKALIRRLEDGLPEWKASGFPVESAA